MHACSLANQSPHAFSATQLTVTHQARRLFLEYSKLLSTMTLETCIENAMATAEITEVETVAAFADAYAKHGIDAVDDEYLNKRKSTSTSRRAAWDKIKAAMDTYAMKKNLEQVESRMDAMEASLRRIEGALTRARDDDEATPVGSAAKRTRVD